ncbi:MAG: mechanosensitive ion channel [Alphaproteobacteria bacterium]
MLVLCLALAPLAASAQEQTVDGTAEGASEAGANSLQLQRERVEALIGTLEDPQQRQELIAQLRLLLEAQDQAAPPDQQGSVGDELLGQLSQQFEALGEAIDAIIAAPDDMVDMWAWLREDVANANGRSRWYDILRTAGLSLLAAFAAYFLLRIPARRFGERLATPGQALFSRLWRGAAGFGLDALPVLAFAAAGSAALAAIDAAFIARALTTTLLNVVTIALATCALIRVITRPRRPAMRLLPLSDGEARNTTRRLFWVVGIMAVAYAVAQTLPRIGMPWSARTAILTIAAVVSAGLVVALIVRLRRPIQYAIERSARKGSLSGDVFHWVARNWHTIAIVLVLVLTVTYIAGGDSLFVGVLGQIGWSLLAGVLALGAWRLVVVINERRDRKAKVEQTDGDAVRQSGSVLLRLTVRFAIFAALLALLVHIWVFDIVGWLGNDAGRALMESLVTIAIILALAFAANRAIAAVIDRIQRSRRAEAAEHRRRRVETLLPLLRNAAGVIIGAVALLIVLSEIGLDITPLLASAGVIGIAIGFGAQSLVKDVITGLFILMEDAVGVGDVVTVAGYTGVVEEMSIRTIRLRDFAGNLHVIPFGVVDAATNMTRDFSYAVFEVGVSYDSDVDQVIACMHDVDAALREDAEIRANILEPIQVVGLDSFGDNAVVIKARIKTRPGQQWVVYRAYNRLLKIYFDERGIEIPFPQMTLHSPARHTGAAGAAAPATLAPESIDSESIPTESNN